MEYARGGGRINTDALDNSAGVSTSDHEVNIKILLADVERAGALTRPQRDALLGEMTEEVGRAGAARQRGAVARRQPGGARGRGGAACPRGADAAAGGRGRAGPQRRRPAGRGGDGGAHGGGRRAGAAGHRGAAAAGEALAERGDRGRAAAGRPGLRAGAGGLFPDAAPRALRARPSRGTGCGGTWWPWPSPTAWRTGSAAPGWRGSRRRPSPAAAARAAWIAAEVFGLEDAATAIDAAPAPAAARLDALGALRRLQEQAAHGFLAMPDADGGLRWRTPWRRCGRASPRWWRLRRKRPRPCRRRRRGATPGCRPGPRRWRRRRPAWPRRRPSCGSRRSPARRRPRRPRPGARWAANSGWRLCSRRRRRRPRRARSGRGPRRRCSTT